MANASQKKGPVGRPRASKEPAGDDVRNDIILAAANLFREKGYGGSSIREIAEAAGLKKASLYYYFDTKEAILQDMIQGVMAPPLAFVERLDAETSPAAVKLWAYLYFDTKQLCEAPFDYSWFLTMMETRTDAFEHFWQEREDLLGWIREQVRSAIASGVFSETDEDMAAASVFCLDEFAVTWSKPLGASNEKVATYVADFAIRGLLAKPSRLKSIRSEAQRLLPS